MSTINKICGILMLLSFFLFSCENPNEIGFDLSGEADAKAIFSDTISLGLSTVLADSNSNDRGNYIMTGSVVDPIFGSVSTTAYFQPTLKFRSAEVIDTFKINANPIVDSIRLRLINTGLYFGDSLRKGTFGIHRLKSSINYTKTYNGSDALDYDPTALVKFTISSLAFKNATRDTLLAYYVTLPIALGKELLAAATAASASNEKLVSGFKGLAIVPESNVRTVFPLSTGPFGPSTSTLITYWHYDGDATKNFYEFDINGPRFSTVNTNRAGSRLSLLTAFNKEIKSTKLSPDSYMQSGAGIYTKINFANLKNLGSNIKVSRASLEFVSDKSNIDRLFPKIYNFVLAEPNSQNQPVKNAAGSPSYITPIGSDRSGGLFQLVDSTNTVSMDITNYVQKMAIKKVYTNSLLLLPAVPTTDGNAVLSNDNLRRMVFRKPILRIYYTRY